MTASAVSNAAIAFVHFGLADDAGRHEVRAIEVHERPRSLFAHRGHELVHGLRVGTGGVERHERFASHAVADELEGPEHTETAHLADRRMPRREIL